MLDSNKNWKNKYFFFQRIDWVRKPKEWDSMPDGFDNTWGIVRESGESSVSVSPYLVSFNYVTNLLLFVFSSNPSIDKR